MGFAIFMMIIVTCAEFKSILLFIYLLWVPTHTPRPQHAPGQLRERWIHFLLIFGIFEE